MCPPCALLLIHFKYAFKKAGPIIGQVWIFLGIVSAGPFYMKTLELRAFGALLHDFF